MSEDYDPTFAAQMASVMVADNPQDRPPNPNVNRLPTYNRGLTFNLSDLKDYMLASAYDEDGNPTNIEPSVDYSGGPMFENLRNWGSYLFSPEDQQRMKDSLDWKKIAGGKNFLDTANSSDPRDQQLVKDYISRLQSMNASLEKPVNNYMDNFNEARNPGFGGVFGPLLNMIDPRQDLMKNFILPSIAGYSGVSGLAGLAGGAGSFGGGLSGANLINNIAGTNNTDLSKALSLGSLINTGVNVGSGLADGSLLEKAKNIGSGDVSLNDIATIGSFVPGPIGDIAKLAKPFIGGSGSSGSGGDGGEDTSPSGSGSGLYDADIIGLQQMAEDAGLTGEAAENFVNQGGLSSVVDSSVVKDSEYPKGYSDDTGLKDDNSPLDPNYKDPFAAPDPRDDPLQTTLMTDPSKDVSLDFSPVFQTPEGVVNTTGDSSLTDAQKKALINAGLKILASSGGGSGGGGSGGGGGGGDSGGGSNPLSDIGNLFAGDKTNYGSPLKAYVQPNFISTGTPQQSSLYEGLDPKLVSILSRAHGGAVHPQLQRILSDRGYDINPVEMVAGPEDRYYARHAKRGFAVNGEGTGQSDDIPTMLADGEYVFDSDTVSALGDGSSKAGAAVLDKMREQIRMHKRSAPINKIPPKAKSPLDYLKRKGNNHG